MNPRVTAVQAHDDHTLTMHFTHGEIRRIDLRPGLHYPVFAPLQTPAFFQLARCGHGTVIWPQDINFDPDMLYLVSQPIEAFQAA